MKGCPSECIALKMDVIGQEIYCLQARACIIQPGKFTGWGSERVKRERDTARLRAAVCEDS